MREELGTGSKSTIHRYLKEIEEEEGGATGTRVAVSEAIQELVGRLAARVNEEAEERVTAKQQLELALATARSSVTAQEQIVSNMLERFSATASKVFHKISG